MEEFSIKKIDHNDNEKIIYDDYINNTNLDVKFTGKIIKGIPEYNFQGVRFLFKKGNSERLHTFFSSFSSRGQEQKYNYVKISLENAEDNFLFFLDTEMPKSDPRGTYFVGDKNLTYSYKIKAIILSIVSKIYNPEIFYFGSSKGGAGAIIIASLINKGTVCVNAPQILIGDYLLKSYDSKSIDDYIDIDFYNKLIFERLEYMDNVNIYITCGVKDDYIFKEHLLNIIFNKPKNISNIELIPVRGAHDGLALTDYSDLINEIINSGDLQYRISTLTRRVRTYYLSLKNSYLFQDIDSITERLEVDRKFLKNQILNNSIAIWLNANTLLIAVSNLYGFRICVYAKNSGDKTIAKSEGYKLDNHIFKLESKTMMGLDSLKFFVEFNNDIFSFKVIIKDINLFSLVD